MIGTGDYLKSEMSLFNNILSNSLRPDDAYVCLWIQLFRVFACLVPSLSSEYLSLIVPSGS